MELITSFVETRDIIKACTHISIVSKKKKLGMVFKVLFKNKFRGMQQFRFSFWHFLCQSKSISYRNFSYQHVAMAEESWRWRFYYIQICNHKKKNKSKSDLNCCNKTKLVNMKSAFKKKLRATSNLPLCKIHLLQISSNKFHYVITFSHLISIKKKIYNI
ncbi:hypothetical protein RFI_34359 [Reticulomyxa filosa]|uniref:Uncharacterized protein n=1 Tax=Reticulomyxa filosa TaxID=46433 RepID=X6LN70_RETFI|nr:hypothetical protein RFI_34359 [Reticulomyxa filosa]|eukprot:ETO03054.1 hypothetical protein RFI_34359 [Reticulomyxa filosa]